MTDALFAQPPQKPEVIKSPWGIAAMIALYEWHRLGVWMAIASGPGLIVLPLIMLFGGAYNGLSFGAGLFMTAAVVAGVTFAPFVFLWPLDFASSLLAQRRILRAYAQELAAWEAGAEARAIARRRHHGLVLFNGLLKEANAKRMQPVLAAQQAAQRRAVLEKQLAEIFRQYRLRNDWDASDATLVPRLQAAFRKWVQEKPPFPPQDMALLATSADAGTRALLPAPTASSS